MGEVLVFIAIIAGLVLLNGVFVAAEFALIGAPRARIERLATGGNRAAVLLRDILLNPARQDQYVATAQLGITFASLGLGMYGEHKLAGWLAADFEALGVGRWIAAHALASVVAIGMLTYLHIVIGEMIPKSLALMKAERTALAIVRPMMVVKLIFYPLVITLNAIGNAVLRLVGVRREFGTSSYHSREELEYIVKESQEGGALRLEYGQVLRDVMAFGGRMAREVMVPRVRVAAISIGDTTQELRRLLKDEPRTRYPLYNETLDEISGLLHVKDVLGIVREGRPVTRADARPIAFVPATATLDSVLSAMRRIGTQMCIVMDEQGGTAGILTIEDLCVEIVGEFEEGAEDAPEIRRINADTALADGTLRLDDLGEAFGRVLEHEEVDTISGLVLTILNRPAQVGDTVTFEGFTFTVTAIEGRGVRECRITAPDEPDGEEWEEG